MIINSIFGTVFTSIRSKIVFGMLIVVTVFLILVVVIIQSLSSINGRYNDLVSHVVDLYQITTISDEYALDFLEVVGNIRSDETVDTFREAISELSSSTKAFDQVNGDDSRVLAQGTKNIISEMLEKGGDGFDAALNQDSATAFSNYDEIARNAVFVNDNIAKLVLLELGQTDILEDQVEQDSYIIFVLSLVVTVVMVIFGILLANWLATQLTEPISDLSEFVRKLDEQKYSQPVPDRLTSSTSEVGVLAKAFEMMRKRIHLTLDELRNSKVGLEDRNRDLERMSRAMVGREMKMIDLKKQLEELTKDDKAENE